ncbi:MAG: small basic protein [Sedimentisphaerales bacterium]|nr:small basic protein [Sedimentisphaerales bacterium]
MSLDRSLKSRDALTRHRNVLKRVERLEKLADEELWSEDKDSVFGLPKVAHRKLAAGKKTKKAKEGEEGAAETTEAGEKTE